MLRCGTREGSPRLRPSLATRCPLCGTFVLTARCLLFWAHNLASANVRCCRSVAAGRVGANRIVLFDSDWNPATDDQVRRRGSRRRRRDGWASYVSLRGRVGACARIRIYSSTVVRGDNSIRAVCFVARDLLDGVFDIPGTGGRLQFTPCVLTVFFFNSCGCWSLLTNVRVSALLEAPFRFAI